MDIINGIKNTPLPTLLLIGGFILVVLGIATIKKPIVIEVTPSSRKIALVLGVLLIGISVYLMLVQPTSPAAVVAETSTANLTQPPTLIPENIGTFTPSSGTPQAIKGYMLFWDDKRVGYAPDWTCQQALENLLWNVKQYPEKKVEGWFGEKKIDVAGTGYELFWNCERMGNAPDWNHQQALENLIWNINQYPDKKVDGLFNGESLIP